MLLTEEKVAAWVTARALDAHKYEVGAVLVVGGSGRYAGAAELAARGALRSGAGLVTVASGARFPGGWPEVMHWPLSWRDGPLEALRRAPRADARVIGPGLDAVPAELMAEVVGLSGAVSVLDAGALHGSTVWRRAVREHGRCVLTPHEGEAARLLGVESDAVRADRAGAAREIVELTGAVVVLKGAVTMIDAPDGRRAASDRGHPGMATGGSGDVLAGCLGALACRIADPFQAACVAVFACGLAGEAAARRHGNGLIPSDTVDGLGAALMGLEAGFPAAGEAGAG